MQKARTGVVLQRTSFVLQWTGGALERTWVALQRTGGALERTCGTLQRTDGALDMTRVALQRTDGSLERTGGAKRQDWRCVAKDWFCFAEDWRQHSKETLREILPLKHYVTLRKHYGTNYGNITPYINIQLHSCTDSAHTQPHFSLFTSLPFKGLLSISYNV